MTLYTCGDKSPGYCHMSLRDAVWAGNLGHDPKSLSAFVERSDLLTLKKS